jgi:hypothetical protein
VFVCVCVCVCVFSVMKGICKYLVYYFHFCVITNLLFVVFQYSASHLTVRVRNLPLRASASQSVYFLILRGDRRGGCCTDYLVSLLKKLKFHCKLLPSSYFLEDPSSFLPAVSLYVM